jgi:hypothetical protein
MSIFPTTVLLATNGSEEQSWWCVIIKRDTHCALYLLPIINVPKLHTL